MIFQIGPVVPLLLNTGYFIAYREYRAKQHVTHLIVIVSILLTLSKMLHTYYNLF